MDEQLKQRLLVSIIPGGLVFFVFQFVFNSGGDTTMLGFFGRLCLALVLGLAVSGITYGVMIAMGR